MHLSCLNTSRIGISCISILYYLCVLLVLLYVPLTSPHFPSRPLGCSPTGSMWWRPWTWGGWWSSSRWRPERPHGTRSPRNGRKLWCERTPKTNLWMLLPANAPSDSDVPHLAKSETNTCFGGEVFSFKCADLFSLLMTDSEKETILFRYSPVEHKRHG